MSKPQLVGIQKFRAMYPGIVSPMMDPELVDRRRKNKMSDQDIVIEENVKNMMREHLTDSTLSIDLFCKLLDTQQISYGRDVQIGDRCYDILVNNNILINICPSESHNVVITKNSEYGIYSGEHYNAFRDAVDNGYRCIHLFDWDDPIVIVSNLCKEVRQYTKRVVEPIDKLTLETFKFQHDIINRQTRYTTYYGLFEDDYLVAVAVFGKCRNKYYKWELVDYIEDSIYTQPDRVSYVVDELLREFGKGSVVYYLDNSKEDVSPFIDAGFECVKERRPARFWSKGIERKSNVSLAVKSKDILQSDLNKDIGLSTYLLQEGWLPVYDCGKSICVWKEDK